ncbi:hypothetical protein [Streptomyces sp. NBC_00827]|uniref:TRADD-N-associated membrane domain-containing protein n=1 Tax=Streptomyces sp. NBC_00827 TaxID=2903677 RepID=UPI00386C99ED|nr:hypothetical protein OG569_10050 [Streptomyces sp. NBC_00827]
MSDNSSSSSAAKARRLQRRISIAIAVLGALAGMNLPSFLPLSEQSPTKIAIGAAFVVVVVAFMVAYIVFPSRIDERGISEGRERVRAAERDLEAALRTARSEDRGGVITGDVHVYYAAPDGTASAPADGGPIVQDGLRLASPHLTLPELWTVTHTRLDLYHDIATGQARRSFGNAQVAMIAGFVLLLVFVGVALNASTTAGSVVAGGLGAVSAALSGFVSRTFVKSQEAAAAHLRAYFDQPLEFSRYLAAERLIADADLKPEQRAEVLTSLVEAMVTPPGVPVADRTNGQRQAES